MEQTSKVLGQVADATLNQTISMDVDIKALNRWHAWMQAKGLRPKKRRLVIDPIVLGTLIRISKLLLSIEIKGISRDKMLEGNYRLATDHGDKLALIIATAIHNKESEVPASLVKFIEWNFSSSELLKVLLLVIRQMDITNFMTTIISARGLNVLEIEPRQNGKSEVSPVDQGRSIAPGTSSEG